MLAKGRGKIDMLPSFLLWSIENLWNKIIEEKLSNR